MTRAQLLLILPFASVSPAGAQTLLHVESHFDGDIQGVETIDGLNFAWTTAVSSDGNNVYVCSGVGNVAGDDDNAVAVFSRDSTTGKLTFVEAEFDDQDAGNPGTAA